MKKVLFAFGTRPEAVKMAPLISEFKSRNKIFKVEVCITSQHREMLNQILNYFLITPDYNLDLMKDKQELSTLTAKIISSFDVVLKKSEPDIVIVQGDTTTTLACSLAAFYKKIEIVHIEAGLRTSDRYLPFPEEVNRRLVSSLANYHFAPTEKAKNALIRDNIDQNTIFVTGNTVVDSLLSVLEDLKSKKINLQSDFSFIDKKFVLITGHRRESFGKQFEEICKAIKDLAKNFEGVNFVYSVHLNPNVQKPVKKFLSKSENIFLIPPQSYLEFVWLMNASYLIMTDSGGIQEEAPTLGKPLVIMRNKTERMEAIEAGLAVLAGTKKRSIIECVSTLLLSKTEYSKMQSLKNPFGDGNASNYIADHVENISRLNKRGET